MASPQGKLMIGTGIRYYLTKQHKAVMIRNDRWTLYDYGKACRLVYYKTAHVAPEGQLAKRDPAPGERFRQAKQRAKAAVFELAMCNNFTHFCTLTMDKALRDRHDLEGFVRDFGQFVRNQNRGRAKDRKLKYLLVPERHLDGAWHMHGLLMGLDGADLRKNEHGYLDWMAYRNRFGFFSVSPVRDSKAVSGYLCKYVTKTFEEASLEAGKHLYFASQGLARKKPLVYNESGRHLPVTWDFENDYVKVVWVEKGSALYRELLEIGGVE